jgi:hypothetical protein
MLCISGFMVLLSCIDYDITNRVTYTHIYAYFIALYVGPYIKHLSNYYKFLHVLVVRTFNTALFELRMCAPF